MTTRIMDHTNAPDFLWYEALQYASILHNHTSKKVLQGKNPIYRAFVITPDISTLLQFSFYEPIYYLDAEITFPYSRDLPGTFLGLATNVGDALTYRVLTSDNTILSRSVMRSALDNININQRALSTSDGGDHQ